jgi:hypothetical protein
LKILMGAAGIALTLGVLAYALLELEYQFNLDTAAGRAALARSLAFLSSAARRAGA